MKTYTLDQIQDKYIGKKGTKKRDQYELELNLELIGETIKQARKQRHLTQEDLGKLVGVQKAQISKIENNPSNLTIETILKVFKALKADVKLNVHLLNNKSSVA